jgi:hypothetical protein
MLIGKKKSGIHRVLASLKKREGLVLILVIQGLELVLILIRVEV